MLLSSIPWSKHVLERLHPFAWRFKDPLIAASISKDTIGLVAREQSRSGAHHAAFVVNRFSYQISPIYMQKRTSPHQKEMQ